MFVLNRASDPKTVSHFSGYAPARGTHPQRIWHMQQQFTAVLYPRKAKLRTPVFSVTAFNFLLQMQGITVANELPKQAMGKHSKRTKKPTAAMAAAGSKSERKAFDQ
ncbi:MULTISPECIES: hypothetical protein [Brucella/Ochrobactrum group]|uniref:Uncharacterized protein n=3 Tax=Brucella anthropi TaxID=529 RepID=A0A6I0DV37_BRUAN|nr:MULTISPECIES: hypothetical protein [Brucella/Ochrobactrum group]MCR5941579.1 hypothetical protein [Ochrobactrum sp. XJ1]QTN03255.1 hypothetical protein GTN27_08765 [Ochrobactrum sp. EEELCW01]KAB2731821.1 hypothetical protein F9K90_18605 [Brucella anthropi]KAB2737668.1 hypothetical protein F9K89_10305 [Brucella anthropi]KAB2752213.1 hypothetical protein F9L05_03615 [Brucella anthropi]